MEFIILTLISSLTSATFFWIERWRFSVLPAFLFCIYIMDHVGNFSLMNSFSRSWFVRYWSLFSRLAIVIGINILLHSQWLSLYYIGWIIIVLNTILVFISYCTNYKEWESTFFWWLIYARFSLCVQWIIRHDFWLGNIVSVVTISVIWIFLLISGIWTRLSQQKKSSEDSIVQIREYKEIIFYIAIYLATYRVIGNNNLATITIWLWCTTLLIMLRQQFLSYQDEITHEKNAFLSARALLQWQKVLTWYASKKDRTYTTMNAFFQSGLVPSSFGLNGLQIIQWIQMFLLVSLSARQLWNNTQYVLFRYWSGVLCFIISLFGLHRQERFFERYKKLALIVLTWAFYLTLFDSTRVNNSFVWLSFVRSMLNMFSCLFYDVIVPVSKRILTRHDLIFWMLWANFCVVITILTLTILKLSGDVFFALVCIIMGLSSFLSYNIWKKYRNE